MKRNLFVFLAFIALLIGCEPETYLFVDETPLAFNEEGGSATIDLVANKDWSASSDVGWCSVTPSFGEGDTGGTRLTVKCNKNDGYDDRSATITLRCAELTKSVSVSQSRKKMLALSQKEFSVEEKGGTITVDVQSNVSYTCTIVEGSSWITAINAKGLSTQTRQFTIKENTTYDARVGRIRFSDTSSGLSEDVVVRQTQNGAIIISQKEYNVSSSSGTITVEVKSNVDFDYRIEEGSSWITAVDTKGLTSQKRQFTVKENTSYDDRDGKIRFYDSATGISEYVEVHQSRKGAIIISMKEYSVAAEGGTIKVQIQSNVNYKYEILSGSTWVSAVNTKGLTTSTVEFTIKENTTYDDREGIIRFSDTATGASEQVAVRQTRAGAIIISKKEYNIGAEGGTITVEMQTNVDVKCQVMSGSSWISVVSTKGLSTRTMMFTIKENTGYDEREGQIRIYDSNSGSSETVVVKQSAKGVVKIEKTQYELTYEAQVLEISLLENTEYDVKIATDSQGWIKKVDTKGLNTSSFSLIIEENEKKAREGVVYVTFGSEIITLKIKQADGTFTIPDASFRQYCVKNFDKNGDGMLSFKEARSVNRIDVTTDDIASLQGIEQFINLQILYCCGSGWNSGQQKYIYGKLTTLDISKNVSLREFGCDYNQLTSLDVSRNTSLTYLYCYSNQLTSLDVSRNTSLTYLNCYSNQLTSLDVSRNTSLQTLSCHSNQLTSLDLSNNRALTYLDCSSNKMTSLNVANSTALQTLYCISNQLTSLDVSRNSALNRLECGSNPLTSLDVSRNTSLTYLNCYSNQLTSLDVSNNTALSYFDCRWNNSNIIIYIKGGQLFNTFLHDDSAVIQEKGAPIPSGNVSFKDSNFKAYCVTNFDKNGDGEVSYAEALSVTRINVTTDNIASLQGIEHFINLQVLYCRGSGWNSSQQKYIYGKLTTLDISKNVSLREFGCYYNQLTSLNVANNTSLQTLSCNSNQLTSLDVSRNTSLQTLSCYSNQLTSLDVSRNTSLTYLYCYSNQLTSLDVSRNSALNRLECGSNPLTSLDVSRNTSLTYLNCYSNQLTSLDVSRNTSLTYLNCNSNQLTSLDVTTNTLLEYLYCYNTTMTDLYLAPGQSFKNYDWYSGTKVHYK